MVFRPEWQRHGSIWGSIEKKTINSNTKKINKMIRKKLEYCRNNGFFLQNYKSKMGGISEITVTSRNSIVGIETFDDRIYYDGEYRKYNFKINHEIFKITITVSELKFILSKIKQRKKEERLAEMQEKAKIKAQRIAEIEAKRKLKKRKIIKI